jgi:hypothetical protein
MHSFCQRRRKLGLGVDYRPVRNSDIWRTCDIDSKNWLYIPRLRSVSSVPLTKLPAIEQPPIGKVRNIVPISPIKHTQGPIQAEHHLAKSTTASPQPYPHGEQNRPFTALCHGPSPERRNDDSARSAAFITEVLAALPRPTS